MIIDQLPLLASDVQDTDEFPIERGTTTYKTTRSALVKSAADAAAAAQSTADGAQSAAAAAQQSANVALTRAMPSGGTTGQVLAKASNTSYNTQWIDPPDPSGFVSYAEAQTLTDAQKSQAKENIGANWALLWENASPTSEFAAQSIAANLSNYDTIKILVKSSYTGIAALYYDIPNVVGAYVIPSIYGNIEASGAVTLYNRRITITSSGFDVTDGRGKTLSSTSTPPVANTVCIPWKIYGGNLL